jgi:hypothetical protein
MKCALEFEFVLFREPFHPDMVWLKQSGRWSPRGLPYSAPRAHTWTLSCF